MKVQILLLAGVLRALYMLPIALHDRALHYVSKLIHLNSCYDHGAGRIRSSSTASRVVATSPCEFHVPSSAHCGMHRRYMIGLFTYVSKLIHLSSCYDHAVRENQVFQYCLKGGGHQSLQVSCP